MDLSRALLKDFADITRDPSDESSKNLYVRGTIKTVGNRKFVQVDGSEGLTPISEVVDVDTDDRVLVSIENHVATILGNFTFPPSARKEEEALNKAEDANNNANNANNNASNAVNKAEEAGQKADSAIESAGQASQLAGQAVNKAEEAFTAADNANKNLEETKQLATDANNKSDTAIDKATQAQSNVANAQTEINKIDKVVQGVKGDISSALTDLHDLADKTTAIKQTMELEYSKKTELSKVETTLRSEISHSVGEIKTEISETYASKSYVDSIKTGSTNLALKTSSKWSDWITPPASSNNSCHTGAVAHLPNDQKIGDKYTSQIEIEFLGVKAGTGSTPFKFHGNGACRENPDAVPDVYNGVVWGDELFFLDTPPKDGVYKFTHTYTIREVTNKYHVIDLGFRADNWDGAGKYRYRCIKVEKGDKAGDWTPAPSELATNDSLVEIEGKLQSQITQNASGLSSTVSKVEKLESNTEEAQKLVTEALSNAFDAQAAAEQAQRSAVEAKRKADEAKANSIVANEKAAEAKKLADAARQQVEIADRQLADARATLQEAKQNLDNVIANGGTPEEIAAAQQRVDEATKAVDQALADVAEAELAATNAQKAANKAQKDADEAQLIADNAKKKADNAKAVADQALKAAELAAQRVAELTKRIDQAETAITQNAEKIELTANKTTEIGDTLKNNYWTKAETEAAIKLSSDEIMLGVSSKKETIKSSKEQFYLSTSPTTLSGGNWSYTPPTWTPQKYIWRRTLVTYADDRSEYTPSQNGVCITGNDGASGKGVKKTEVYYYLSTSNTELIGGSWVTTPPLWIDGRYYWQKIKTTYTDGEVNESKPVCITGAKGESGDSGKYIASIAIEFYLSTSKVDQVGGEWVAVMPSWSRGKYLWTRNKITYNNPQSIEYTTPVCDSSWEAVNDVENDLHNNYYDKTETQAQIDIKTDTITQTVSKTYTTKKEFNDLKIGGRNLLLNSDKPVTNSSYIINTYTMTEKMSSDQTYTCRLWGKLGDDKSRFMIYLDGGSIECGKLNSDGNGVYSLTFTGKTGTNDISKIFVYAYPQSGTTNSTISKIQLEIGNKATDWSPAPEGMASADSLTGVNKSLTDTANNLQNAIDSTNKNLQDVQNSQNEVYEIVSENKTQISSLTQRAEGFQMDFKTVNETVKQLNNQFVTERDERYKYIKFIDGEIWLGKEVPIGEDDFKLVIKNDRISFLQNKTEVAYMSNNKLYVTDIHVTNSLQLGKFVWASRTNGNVGLRWIGN